MKMKNVKMIEVRDWDKLVVDTYKRPYSLQQQDGCMSRGIINLKVPDVADDYKNETVPENVNDEKMGVSFSAWLARDPKQKLSNPEDQQNYSLVLWWDRNFYPYMQMIANDLHQKGILAAGKYIINIDW